MALKVIFTSLTIVICLTCCCANDEADGPKDFDFLLFTQRWPETTCYDWMKRNKGHTCRLPTIGNGWTVHGIWPSRNGTKEGPFYCNKSMPFDMDQIKALEPKLNEYWTNVEKETPEDGLWKHEWEKHGTCASVLQPFHSENYYFGQGLSWLNIYAMGPLLSKAGIKPDSEIYVGHIHNAIYGELKVNPVIECLHESGGRQMITEIRLCFDKELKLRHCDGAVGVQTKMLYTVYETTAKGSMITNCDPMKTIEYPSQVPKVDYAALDRNAENEAGSTIPWVAIYKVIKFLRFVTF